MQTILCILAAKFNTGLYLMKKHGLKKTVLFVFFPSIIATYIFLR